MYTPLFLFSSLALVTSLFLVKAESLAITLNSTVTNNHGSPLSRKEVFIVSKGQTYMTHTDENGNFQHPTNWRNLGHVTIVGNDHHMTITWGGQNPDIPRKYVLPLRPKDLQLPIEGIPHGYQGVTSGNGYVDVGVVFPALQLREIINLEIERLLSHEIDVIDLGRRSFEVPANFAFPKQRERYFIRLNFDKPSYQLSLPYSDQWRIVASQARFKVNSVVRKLLHGTSMIDVINDFEVLSTQWHNFNRSHAPESQIFNPSLNRKKLNSSVQIQAPSQPPETLSIITSLAKSPWNNIDYYHPIDIKTLASQESQSVKLSNLQIPHWIVATLSSELAKSTIGPESEQMAVNFLRLPPIVNQPIALPDFLPLVHSPQKIGSLILVHPPQITGATTHMTHAKLTEVFTIQKGTVQYERKIPIWEAFFPGWVPEIRLPNDVENRYPVNKNTTLRWTVSFIKSGKDIPIDPFEYYKKVEYLTRSSINVD